MFIQDNLQKLKVFSEEDFSKTKFLTMFIGVVIAPMILFVIGGRSSETLWQSSLIWTLLFIGMLPTVSVAIGLMKFNNESPSNNSIRVN